jgi:DNA-binding GntR family transcriptional regulator
VQEENTVFHSKSDYAYSSIKKEILDGRLAAGQRLVISKLAATLNISEIPVRDALSRLSFEGLVDVGSNNRSVVSTVTPAELHDTIELRIALEPLCSEIAVPFVTSETVAQLDGLIVRIDSAIAAGDFNAIGLLNREFHQNIYRHCPNKILVEIIEHLYKASYRARMIYQIHRGRCEESNREHRLMVEAILSRDSRRMFELVQFQKRSALMPHLEMIDALA